MKHLNTKAKFMKRYLTIALLLLVAMPMPLFSAQAAVSNDFVRRQLDSETEMSAKGESSM